MFDTLSERLGGIFDGLTGRGALSEKDVNAALREIRVALLEADVALPVVAGLQGAGKTTTTGKLAKRLSEKERKRVLLASLDTRRPAAMEQLAILADQCNENVSALPIIQGQLPADIARRALNAAKISGYDVLILDTAGRTTIDEQMMNEVAEIAQIANPSETLLVADALTGQDAVETASRFNARLPLTGLVLTPSMPSAWLAGFSDRAILSRWSRRPPSRWTPKRPSAWRRNSARANSTLKTWPTSSVRCSVWAVLAA